jgi:hypothetical protein
MTHTIERSVHLGRLDGPPPSPPDAGIGAGTDHVVTAKNYEMAISDKQDVDPVLYGTSLSQWFEGIGVIDNGDDWEVFDPRVTYDIRDDHYILIAAGINDNEDTGAYLISVSNSGNALGDWHGSKIEKNGCFPDFPGLGVSADYILLTGNLFDINDNSKCGPSEGIVIDKATIYQGLPITYAIWNIKDADGNDGFAPQPVQNSKSTVKDAAYFAHAFEAGGNQVAINEITNPTRSFGNQTVHSIDVSSYSPPPSSAPQDNSEDKLRVPGSGLTSRASLWENQIWFAHTVLYDWDSSDSTVEANVAWKVIDIASWSLIEEGGFGLDEIYFMLPALSQKNAPHVDMVFTRTGYNEYPNLGTAEYQRSDRSRDFEVLANAPSPIGDDDASADIRDFGDYNCATTDNSEHVWVLGEMPEDSAINPDYQLRLGEIS